MPTNEENRQLAEKVDALAKQASALFEGHEREVVGHVLANLVARLIKVTGMSPKKFMKLVSAISDALIIPH